MSLSNRTRKDTPITTAPTRFFNENNNGNASLDGVLVQDRIFNILNYSGFTHPNKVPSISEKPAGEIITLVHKVERGTVYSVGTLINKPCSVILCYPTQLEVPRNEKDISILSFLVCRLPRTLSHRLQ